MREFVKVTIKNAENAGFITQEEKKEVKEALKTWTVTVRDLSVNVCPSRITEIQEEAGRLAEEKRELIARVNKLEVK